MERSILDALNYRVILYDPNNLIKLDDISDELNDKFRYTTSINDIVECDLLFVIGKLDDDRCFDKNDFIIQIINSPYDRNSKCDSSIVVEGNNSKDFLGPFFEIMKSLFVPCLLVSDFMDVKMYFKIGNSGLMYYKEITSITDNCLVEQLPKNISMLFFLFNIGEKGNLSEIENIMSIYYDFLDKQKKELLEYHYDAYLLDYDGNIKDISVIYQYSYDKTNK